MKQSELCRRQADDCRRMAEASPLANVRERYAKSMAAWTSMAIRSERMENVRAERATNAEELPLSQ